MTNAAEQPEYRTWDDDAETPEEREARWQKAPTLEELLAMNIGDPFESDEEWQEFLDDLYASRRRGLG